MSMVAYEIKDDVGIITLNNPPVNALSQKMRSGLLEAVQAAEHDDTRALVVMCEGRTFVAGADITEFGKPPQAPVLPDVFAAVENSVKPIVAAMHGSVLGGGLELALACHYRCALASATFGFPEVNLGLMPGAGGTQRAPRLAGIEAALQLLTSGDAVSAAQAMEIGLIDHIIEDNLFDGVMDYVTNIIKDNRPVRRTRDIEVDMSAVDSGIFEKFREKLAKTRRGQTAPQRIVECVEAAVKLPVADAFAKERELFLECKNSSQSEALRHIFFAQRKASKIKGISGAVAEKEIRRGGVVGGGTMGSGIAMCLAQAGIPVTLLEINEEALQRGKDIIAGNYAHAVKKGKIPQSIAAHEQALITGSTDYNDLGNADIVIEAVFENLEIKKEVFTKLDAVCKPGAILATNTSYLDVNSIARSTSRPHDVIGLHFFSPANVMKLLEIIRADQTSDELLASAMALAKKIRKIPVLAKVCYGFIGNRMLRHYQRETQMCLIEGATPEQIDRVMERFGMAMGPLAVNDLTGLDIGYKARQELTDAQKGDPKTYRIGDTLVEMGRLGQKSGAGWYRYDPAFPRIRLPDPAVCGIIRREAEKFGVAPRQVSDEEILQRCVFALVNEGMKILEEGTAQRPGDIDVVYVFGYGFPAYRGGPMYYADSLGLDKVYDAICRFRRLYDEQYWQPAPLLERLVRENMSLTQLADDLPSEKLR